MIPGEIRTQPGALELSPGRERRTMVIVNGGDRPIQIGSHLHLPDANPALQFDRDAAAGYRLDIPAGTSVRLEPGVSRTVEIVALGGRAQVPGIQVRGRPASQIPVEREPRKVVPFGTPNTQVADPGRASGAQMRISDEDPEDNPSEQSEEEQE